MRYLQRWCVTIFLIAAQTTALHAAPPEKDRYIVSRGKGWGVCEAYVKALNALEQGAEFPYCNFVDLKAAGVTQPNWETLDIEAHLPWVHQIEINSWRTYGIGDVSGDDWPSADFETWKEYRQARVQKFGHIPRLRRVRLPLVDGGPIETLLAYDGNLNACANAKQDALRRFGHLVGQATSPMKAVYDETTQRVMYQPGWDARSAGAVALYRQRPYLVMPDVIPPGTNPNSIPNVVISRFEPGLHLSEEERAAGKPGYQFRQVCWIHKVVNPMPVDYPIWN